eukprot:TRINITY_DN74551_c0_g1_i1.p1 TRINITY_DN74551_c0_g1~~TRINITY_DN74551_c0_g1_i1.p1  ORF type:complete len:489 (-),score=75.50 TRINITY_DN74551_c0_g1_i1:416-1882(-)
MGAACNGPRLVDPSSIVRPETFGIGYGHQFESFLGMTHDNSQPEFERNQNEHSILRRNELRGQQDETFRLMASRAMRRSQRTASKGRRSAVSGFNEDALESLPLEVHSLGMRVDVAVTGRASGSNSIGFESKEFACFGIECIEDLVDACGVGLGCRAGSQPSTPRPNQDDCFFVSLKDRFRVFGVIDGHGANGHFVAAEVRNVLMRTLIDKIPLRQKNEIGPSVEKLTQVVQAAFATVQNRLLGSSSGKLDAKLSGASACVVVHDLEEHQLVVAWLGNCRCIAGQLRDKTVEKGCASEDGFSRSSKRVRQRLTVVPVTQDHTTFDDRERARVEASFAELRTAPASAVVPHGRPYAPVEIFVRGEDWPGIPLTRCAGNFLAQTIGVSRTPSVVSLPAKDECGTESFKLLVIASDGLWNVLSENDIISILGDSDKEALAYTTNFLVEKANRIWTAREDTTMQVADDLTVLVAWMSSRQHSPCRNSCMEEA